MNGVRHRACKFLNQGASAGGRYRDGLGDSGRRLCLRGNGSVGRALLGFDDTQAYVFGLHLKAMSVTGDCRCLSPERCSVNTIE